MRSFYFKCEKKQKFPKILGNEILIEANDAQQCGGVGRTEEFLGIVESSDKFATIDGPLIRSKYCNGLLVGKEICLTCN